MKQQRTYTFQAGNTGFYTWMPRIEVRDGNVHVTTYHPSEASYRRFVRLANSGRYDVTIVAQGSVAWALSRKPQLALPFEPYIIQTQQGDIFPVDIN